MCLCLLGHRMPQKAANCSLPTSAIRAAFGSSRNLPFVNRRVTSTGRRLRPVGFESTRTPGANEKYLSFVDGVNHVDERIA